MSVHRFYKYCMMVAFIATTFLFVNIGTAEAHESKSSHQSVVFIGAKPPHVELVKIEYTVSIKKSSVHQSINSQTDADCSSTESCCSSSCAMHALFESYVSFADSDFALIKFDYGVESLHGQAAHQLIRPPKQS
jgi:hypothetical protein